MGFGADTDGADDCTGVDIGAGVCTVGVGVGVTTGTEVLGTCAETGTVFDTTDADGITD